MLSSRKICGDYRILGYVYDNFKPNLIYYQNIRWRRKPIWLPTAKSKIFKIPQKKIFPEDETIEFQKLYNYYRTAIMSIRKYCIELVEKNKIVLDHTYIEKLEDEDFERCSKINDEWNKAQNLIREKRWAEEKHTNALKIMEEMEAIDRELQCQREVIEAQIRTAKQESHTFITEENIDQAIEEALSSIVNYDKVLDLDGNLYEVKPNQKAA